MSRLSFERSAITQALVVALRGVNGEISYTALAQQVGSDIERVKISLQSARRILAHENLYFGTIHGHGLRLLDDVSIATKQPANIKRIGRAVGRNQKEVAAIRSFERLPLDNQRMVTTARLIYENIEANLKAKPEVEPIVVARGDPTNLVKLAKK